MVTTFQVSHLALHRSRRGQSCTLLLEARMPSRKLSSGLPQMSNGQNCVTCPCSRLTAGTRNGAQRLGKINKDSSPGRMRPTQGGRRGRPEQNRSSVRAEGGRGCLYQPTAGEDLTTHTVILENYSQTQSSDDSSSPFRSSNQSTYHHNYMFKEHQCWLAWV